jgi:heat shock protein HslJ
MNRLMRFLVLAISVVTLLADCSVAAGPSGQSSGGPSASPSDALTVEGKTYLSTAVKGAVLVPGTQVRLSFKDGSLNANGGCNSIGGTYTITGGRLTTTRMLTTEMGCDQPRMQQDAWLSALLSSSTIALAGDTLTLDDGKIQLTLHDREVVDPDRPIEGTNWILDGIRTGDAVSSVPVGVTASIRMADGQVAVNDGCNVGSGTVQVTADTVTFAPLMMSKRPCQVGTAGVGSAVATVLTGTVHYTIEANVLTLDAGASGLTYRAAP